MSLVSNFATMQYRQSEQKNCTSCHTIIFYSWAFNSRIFQDIQSQYEVNTKIFNIENLKVLKTYLNAILQYHKRAASWQNQQNDPSAQRRLRSAWASAQSDQSLRCPHEETLGPQLLRALQRLIRLGGSPGWSESSLGTQTILLVLSWGHSNWYNHKAK